MLLIVSPSGSHQRKVLNIPSLVTQEMGQEGASPMGWQLWCDGTWSDREGPTAGLQQLPVKKINTEQKSPEQPQSSAAFGTLCLFYSEEFSRRLFNLCREHSQVTLEKMLVSFSFCHNSELEILPPVTAAAFLSKAKVWAAVPWKEERWNPVPGELCCCVVCRTGPKFVLFRKKCPSYPRITPRHEPIARLYYTMQIIR